MEKKEGIISFIKQLFSNTPNDKEQIEQANQELDEETKKQTRKTSRNKTKTSTRRKKLKRTRARL